MIIFALQRNSYRGPLGYDAVQSSRLTSGLLWKVNTCRTVCHDKPKDNMKVISPENPKSLVLIYELSDILPS